MYRWLESCYVRFETGKRPSSTAHSTTASRSQIIPAVSAAAGGGKFSRVRTMM